VLPLGAVQIISILLAAALIVLYLWSARRGGQGLSQADVLSALCALVLPAVLIPNEFGYGAGPRRMELAAAVTVLLVIVRSVAGGRTQMVVRVLTAAAVGLLYALALRKGVIWIVTTPPMIFWSVSAISWWAPRKENAPTLRDVNR
jgi:hypothetical protein